MASRSEALNRYLTAFDSDTLQISTVIVQRAIHVGIQTANLSKFQQIPFDFLLSNETIIAYFFLSKLKYGIEK